MSPVKHECYKLVQQVARKQYPYCRFPGCGAMSDSAHHVWKRDRNGTAFNPEAVIALCVKHHDFAHAEPATFKLLAKKIIGYKYDYLRELSLTVVQFREADFIRIRDALIRLLKGADAL